MIKQTHFDYESSTPCKSCRKRTSCLIHPKEGKCISHEEGIPWSMPSRFPKETKQLEDQA